MCNKNWDYIQSSGNSLSYMIALNLLPDSDSACIDTESGDEAGHYVLIT